MFRPLGCLTRRAYRLISIDYRMASIVPLYVAESGTEDAAGSKVQPIKSVLAALIKNNGEVCYLLFIKKRGQNGQNLA